MLGDIMIAVCLYIVFDTMGFNLITLAMAVLTYIAWKKNGGFIAWRSENPG